MATYIVKHGQNLWDISMMLYGSIEGVFDLLISNDKLTLNSELPAGTELLYHEYFKTNKDISDTLSESNITPANGERHVYFKHTDTPLLAICRLPADDIMVQLSLSGIGSLVVDWGDDTALETLELTTQHKTIEHYFDSIADTRTLKLYGQRAKLALDYLDISRVHGDLQPVAPIRVEEVVSRSNSNSLTGLFLFERTNKVDISGMSVESLMPIASMVNLKELDLTNIRVPSTTVIDDYLEYLANPHTHGDRQGCSITMTLEPSARGMKAIRTIIREPSWNTPGPWTFNINGRIYTYIG